MAESITLGVPAPLFHCQSPVNPRFAFDAAAGHYTVLSFLGTLADAFSQQIFAGIRAREDVFNYEGARFFGVTVDPQDAAEGRTSECPEAFYWFYDFDLAVSRLYGAVEETDETASTGAVSLRRFSVILDERLRVFAVIQFGDSPQQHVANVLRALQMLPTIALSQEAPVPAPILIVPRVFEPEFCRTLIQYYEKFGGEESGFMRDIDGKTQQIHDYRHKRRRDQLIEDPQLREACVARLRHRLLPEIQKAFQFQATRIERYIVACYEGQHEGHFRAHRDNTTLATAHRRFAVSLVLNAEEYDGGLLRFAEYGQQVYRPPTGGALVFSCSLLHEATPVTRGKRYVFLPFLYNDPAAKIREENMKYLATE